MNDMIIKVWFFDQLASFVVVNAELRNALTERDKRIAELEAQATKPADHGTTP